MDFFRETGHHTRVRFTQMCLICREFICLLLFIEKVGMSIEVLMCMGAEKVKYQTVEKIFGLSNQTAKDFIVQANYFVFEVN